MPGFDRTGPLGMGPMTGGRRGFYNPAAMGYCFPFFSGAGFGRGMGLGRGFRGGMGRMFRGAGFGKGYGWYPPAYLGPNPYSMDSSSELDMLKAQADSFKSALEAINKWMAELEKSSE
jgi:hypothetical protein